MDPNYSYAKARALFWAREFADMPWMFEVRPWSDEPYLFHRGPQPGERVKECRTESRVMRVHVRPECRCTG